MKLILLGAPGAGKGTQADILAKKLDIPTISTGNILREAIKNETEIGLEARKYTDSGRLVPDEIIIGIINERLSESDCARGYILDGMPRTISQAEALKSAGVVIDAVVLIEISDEEIIDRMTGRRVCPKCGATYHTVSVPPKTAGVCDFCGEELVIRKDDEPETVRERLRVYHEETEPLIAFYEREGNLKSIQSQDSKDDTTAALFAELGINS